MPTLEALGLGNEMFAYAYTEGRKTNYHVRQIAGGRLYNICSADSPEGLNDQIRTSSVYGGVIHPDTKIVRDTIRRFVVEALREYEELNEELEKYRGLTADEVRRVGLAT